jgi:hypothetical protein
MGTHAHGLGGIRMAFRSWNIMVCIVNFGFSHHHKGVKIGLALVNSFMIYACQKPFKKISSFQLANHSDWLSINCY